MTIAIATASHGEAGRHVRDREKPRENLAKASSLSSQPFDLADERRECEEVGEADDAEEEPVRHRVVVPAVVLAGGGAHLLCEYVLPAEHSSRAADDFTRPAPSIVQIRRASRPGRRTS